MKRIIRIFTLCLALSVAVSVSAEARWAVVAGVDGTTLHYVQPLVTVDHSTGFLAGVTGEIMFPGVGFGVDASVLYALKGATTHLGEKTVWASDGYGNEKSYLHYIEIPINLKFKYTNLNGVENYVAPILFGGPVFGILAGHNKVDAFKYAGGDFGLQAGIGAEIMRKFQLNASYTWGLTYALETKKLDNFSARNRGWKVTLSYFF
ncbi:MAG: PorT family protein [Muribaculaceae bacterium]|jgi:hypothetical protein|nr:PorT family protein [Muribaculaceae bacterium]